MDVPIGMRVSWRRKPVGCHHCISRLPTVHPVTATARQMLLNKARREETLENRVEVLLIAVVSPKIETLCIDKDMARGIIVSTPGTLKAG